MFCRSCGLEIRDDANFCPHCGHGECSAPKDTPVKIDFADIKQKADGFVERTGFSKLAMILSAAIAVLNIIIRFFQTGRVLILILTILHLLLSAGLLYIWEKKGHPLEIKPILITWAATLISVIALF